MIEIIDEKNIRNNSINVLDKLSASNLIIDNNEVFFLKNIDDIIINKSNNNDIKTIGLSNYIDMQYNYDKLYLDYSGSINGYNLEEKCFLKKDDNTYLYTDILSDVEVDDRLDETIYNKKEIENKFNSDNYDSMYIINTNGKIIYAKNNIDGIIIDNNIIPSDERIVELKKRELLQEYKLNNIMNPNTIINMDELNLPKTISDVKNYSIFGASFTGRYVNILITSKDNKLSVTYFKLIFVSENKYKLVQAPLRITKPTIDNYFRKYDEDDINRNIETKLVLKNKNNN